MSGVPKAVLFDFSGTLFRFEARDEWFADLHDQQGRPLHVDAQAELVRRMTQPVGLPADIIDDDRIAWEQRDLDPVQHRRAYLAMLRTSGLTVPGQAESLYERVLDPHSWVPFLDTAAVLTALSARRIPVASSATSPSISEKSWRCTTSPTPSARTRCPTRSVRSNPIPGSSMPRSMRSAWRAMTA